MTRIRLLLALVSVVLLMLGYFGSQAARFAGSADRYTQALDGSGVPSLALGLVVAAVALGFVPGKEEMKS